jgi:hypothetical protein
MVKTGKPGKKLSSWDLRLCRISGYRIPRIHTLGSWVNRGSCIQFIADSSPLSRISPQDTKGDKTMRPIRRWIFPLVGSVLIIGSTFISGYLVDKYERQAKEADDKASELEAKFWRSSANLESFENGLAMAMMQWTIMAGYEGSAVETATGEMLSVQLGMAIDEMQLAAGPDVDQEIITNLEAAQSRIASGESIAQTDFISEMQKLGKEALEHQSQLALKQVELEKEASSAEQLATRARTIAIALQLIGLVLLLFREVPENPSARKDPNASSTS